MSELENPFEGMGLGDESEENIFGSASQSGADGGDVFGSGMGLAPTETDPDEEDPWAEADAGALPANPTVAELGVEDSNPLQQAMEQQEQKENQSIFSMPPLFEYGGAKDPVEDASQTFEELRIAKANDFPELSDGKRVSWTVTYGKTVKPISTPKSVCIIDIKREIESSKDFLANLKKATDKAPRCMVKPTVQAQSKGQLAAYKGFFSSLEEARKSDKVICLFPGDNGCLYERRKTEVGEFITPAKQERDVWGCGAGFTPALPRIPYVFLEQIVSFFRALMRAEDGQTENLEALVNIYWDREQLRYQLHVPQQMVSHVSVQTNLGDAPDGDRYLHVADVHSHNTMPARFSGVDDRDEQATRIYIVIGRLDWLFPNISARVSNGGVFLEIMPEEIFEAAALGTFNHTWLDSLTFAESKPQEAGAEK